MKRKPEFLELARKSMSVIKQILAKIEQESVESEIKLQPIISNIVVDSVEIFNNFYLVNEFKERLAPILEDINKYLNKNFDAQNLTIFICFYIKLFQDKSHNFRNICK